MGKWFTTGKDIRPGIYHSKWPNPWGHWMIDWFRNGHLNVMLSARALAQGFDLGADHGLIRTSTSNVRQRIQTIGRMIRKNRRVMLRKSGLSMSRILLMKEFLKSTTGRKNYQMSKVFKQHGN